MSGKLAIRATKAWQHAPTALERITLHECRHTYASFLVAAGYTLKGSWSTWALEPGHGAALRELLPQPEETDPAQRLNAYLAQRAPS